MKTTLLSIFASCLFMGCSGEQPANNPTDKKQETKAEKDEAGQKAAIKTDYGVNVKTKVIKIGAINDISGPAATIGKPYALGKQILTKAINGGDLQLLPAGWKVELLEKDHGYNPAKSVQAYKELESKVLFFATVFGTPNTTPLIPMLASKNGVAFPASLSSEMAKNRNTPPIGPSYQVEAQRAMAWLAETNPDKSKIKAAIIYQQDDYGKDGLNGWKAAAKKHGVTIVNEQTISPGQKDMTAVITSLQGAGATHVLMTVLPSATGPILGTAAKMKFAPMWIGNTPAWIDAFFINEVIPSAVFANYHQINGMPYWGENLPGMKEFLAAFKKYGGDAKPDQYILFSYIQGLCEIEAVKRSIEAGDLTHQGYLKALNSIDNWNANGLLQPLNLKKFPYETGNKTRILKPDFEKKSWKVVADYAESK